MSSRCEINSDLCQNQHNRGSSLTDQLLNLLRRLLHHNALATQLNQRVLTVFYPFAKEDDVRDVNPQGLTIGKGQRDEGVHRAFISKDRHFFKEERDFVLGPRTRSLSAASFPCKSHIGLFTVSVPAVFA